MKTMVVAQFERIRRVTIQQNADEKQSQLISSLERRSFGMPFVARAEQTSASPGAMCQDSEQGRGKIRTIEGKRVKNGVEEKMLAIGIDQSERVFVARPNRNLDSFISFRYKMN